LDVHEERLELRRPRSDVADHRRERVREPVLRQLGVLLGGHADEAPVDRDADLEDLLVSREGDRAETLRDERGDLELAALTRDADAVAVPNALLRGKLLGHLDERL